MKISEYLQGLSEKDKRLPLYVATVGQVSFQSPIHRPAGIPDYQLLYTLQDAGYKVETIDLAYQEIPEDCRLIVVYGPKNDFMVRDGVNEVDEIERLEKKLSNQGFVAKAPAAVVEGEKIKLAKYRENLDGIRAAIAKLK